MANNHPHEETVPLLPNQPRYDQRQSLVAILGMAIIALLAILTVGVFVYLPQQSDMSRQTETTPAMQEETDAADTSRPAPFELARSRHLREEAVQAAEDLLEAQIALERMSVFEWGAEEYDRSSNYAKAGDEYFQQDNYVSASENYRRGTEILNRLLLTKDERRDEALAAADEALAARDLEVAEKQYRLAMSIDPSDSRPGRGLNRVTNLPKVLDLVAQGESAEEAQDYRAARDYFADAIDLDSDWQAAKDGAARVNRKLADLNYRAAMSKGLEALADRDYIAAKQSFETALKIAPNAADARESLAQANELLKSQTIAELFEEAGDFEREEDWESAVQAYDRVLEIDEKLETATNGKRDAQAMLDYNEELDSYLDKPEQLTIEDEYEKAQQLLVELTQRPLEGARIRAKIVKLSEELKLARTEVTLTIESDNRTEVVIFRKMDLGRFETTEVKLYPGTYTIRGQRDGYHDTVRTVKLRPDSVDEVVTIICTEQI